jgi:hypothetical protein
MTVYHKFKAKPTNCDNIKFSSKLEASYYEQLKLRQRAGDVLFFLRQVALPLPASKYVVDFVEFLSNGEVVFTELKGFNTPMGKLKIKQAEELYPIKINVITKV